MGMVFHLPVHEEVFGDMNERLRRKAGGSSPPTGEKTLPWGWYFIFRCMRRYSEI
jgi:hypothetical protein